jgi:hypothetical protein
MTEDELQAIEARAAAATLGPWFGQSTGIYGNGFQLVGRAPDTAATDLEFIAAARTDIPALVAEVRRLREALMYYSLATVVSSWGYEELGSDWEVAREALGLPELTPEERRDILGEPEPFEEDM